MFGTLELKSRPLRIGFLVDPSRATSIRKAIEISSTLWGGAYYPLIPVYKRLPRNWEKYIRKPKAESIVRGYIEAFDPDILVQGTKTLPDYVRSLGLDVIQPHDVWNKGNPHNPEVFPRYGVGIFELYNEIYKEHFRYQEKYPPKIIFPRLPRKNSLFWISVFGSLPNHITDVIDKGYKKALEIKKPKIDASKLDTALKGNVLFPRRITQYDLRSYKRSSFRNEECIFFMDLTKNLDILDYWNLRALGKQVIPAPIQLKDEVALRNIVTKVVKASRRPLRGNPKIYNNATFICSRNSTMEDMQEYAKSLNIQKDPDDQVDESFYSLQHWYPRIWDSWARSKDQAEADDIYYEEKDIDLNDVKDRIHIRFIHPELVDLYVGANEARFANELTFSFYGADKMYAQVLPKCSGEHFNRLIGDITTYKKEWRVGRNGLVKLVQNYERTERWDIPLAQDVLFAYLKDLGWEAKISTPGLLAKQIFSQLDGSVKTLGNDRLLQLLEEMNKGNDEGKEKPVGELKTRLESIGSKNLYDYLISKGVFRVGARIQCSNCQRNSWYSLESLKDTLTCPKCLNTYPAVGHIDSSNWCYKTTGAFSLPGYADGAYCVLISLDYFDDHLSSLKITPALSFEAQDGKGAKLEADFGILWQESLFGEVMEGILFGECKTFGTFGQKDFKKMKTLAKKFPGSVLAFCTLRDSLTNKEIKEIAKIARAGRKRWKRSERPINPVLILTKTELTSMVGAPYCWKDKHGNKFDRVHGLLEIANATQQIYLNLPSWHEEWQKEFDVKRKKWEEKAKAKKGAKQNEKSGKKN